MSPAQVAVVTARVSTRHATTSRRAERGHPHGPGRLRRAPTSRPGTPRHPVGPNSLGKSGTSKDRLSPRRLRPWSSNNATRWPARPRPTAEPVPSRMGACLTEQWPHDQDNPATNGRGCLSTPRSQKLAGGPGSCWHSEPPICEVTCGNPLAPGSQVCQALSLPRVRRGLDVRVTGFVAAR